MKNTTRISRKIWEKRGKEFLDLLFSLNIKRKIVNGKVEVKN